MTNFKTLLLSIFIFASTATNCLATKHHVIYQEDPRQVIVNCRKTSAQSIVRNGKQACSMSANCTSLRKVKGQTTLTNSQIEELLSCQINEGLWCADRIEFIKADLLCAPENCNDLLKCAKDESLGAPPRRPAPNTTPDTDIDPGHGGSGLIYPNGGSSAE